MFCEKRARTPQTRVELMFELVFVCACVRLCVHACVCACVCVRGRAQTCIFNGHFKEQANGFALSSSVQEAAK